jgi:Lar family restriction alleviation protein
VNLKPCPFCGSRAQWCGEIPDEDGELHNCHQIKCTQCSALVEFYPTKDGQQPETLEELRAASAELWNLRATLETSAAPETKRDKFG